MSPTSESLLLPLYQPFVDAIALLDLPISGSELHGVMCGYLSAGAVEEGNTYLRALIAQPTGQAARSAMLVLFEVYAVSQQQIDGLGFEFQLLLPDDHESLLFRAQAFSEWCEGFVQGIRMAGVEFDQLDDDDVQDAIAHINDFADLDYQSLQFDDEDERALTEISEYARMTVLHIHSDLRAHRINRGDAETAH